MRKLAVVASMALLGGGHIAVAQAAHSADVQAYLAAKANYRKDLRARQVAWESPAYLAALRDMETRLRRIIRLDSLGDSTLVPSLDNLYGQEEGSEIIDGLAARIGPARVVVTTSELVTEWLRAHHDPTPGHLADISSEDLLTWAIDNGGHVYRYTDVKSKVPLPPEVFFAHLGTRTNGDPMQADEVFVGVRRGARVYIITAPAAALLSAPASCGKVFLDEYRQCFDGYVTRQRDFAKIVAQVKSLAALVPR